MSFVPTALAEMAKHFFLSSFGQNTRQPSLKNCRISLLIAFGATIGSVHASLLEGKTVSFQYYYPNLSSPYAYSTNGSYQVGGGVEVSDVADTIAQLDISDTNLLVTFLPPAQPYFPHESNFHYSPFNGFVISDESNTVAAFTSVKINSATNMVGFTDRVFPENSTCSFDANHIWVNWGGLAFTLGATIVSIDINSGSGMECKYVGPPKVDFEKSNGDPDECVANPINPGTGTKFQVETDYKSVSPFPIEFERYYNSTPVPAGMFGAKWRSIFDGFIEAYPGGISTHVLRPSGKKLRFLLRGDQWLPDADVTYRLSRVSDAGATYWQLITPENTIERYSLETGRVVSVTESYGYKLTFNYHPTAKGRLLSISDSFGSTLFQFDYDNAERVTVMTDPSGQLHGYRYDTNGYLDLVTHPGLTTRQYLYDSTYPGGLTGIIDEGDVRYATWSYDTQGRATSSQHAGGAELVTVDYGSSSSGVANAHGLMQTSSLLPAQGTGRATTMGLSSCAGCSQLVKNSPSDGSQFKTTELKDSTTLNVKDATATTSALAVAKTPITNSEVEGPGPNSLQFSTSSANSTVVTNANGAARTYNFELVQGLAKATSITGPACPECGPATKSFDENGFLASVTDWNGSQTRLTNNARGLETQRIEGFGSPEARTLTTEWHSDWRLPTRRAEPKRITTYVYNGDIYESSTVTCAPAGANVPWLGGSRPIGVLCQKIEQATSDATGARGLSPAVIGQPRTWTYTYNEFGQVLTENGPRTDAPDTTTYTYHPANDDDLGKRGNLATVTNALLHTTYYTAYDLNGRPLTIVDPNSVTTTLTYWPRGWLKSRTVAGKQTTYDYTPWGGLERITYPDGSYVYYSYDAAHRLTGIADAMGRRVEYTLDGLGNRTKEEYINTDSSKAREVNRVFDALGRLKDEIQGASNPARVYGYYAGGELKFETSPKAKTTNYEIDAHGRTTKKTDPVNSTTKPTLFQYDSLDQLSNLTAPNNAATGFTVDGLGNVRQEVSPDRGTTNLDYDAAGNLLTRTDARGRVETRTWDALNRPLTISYSHGGGSITYTWDTGCAYGKGRLCQIADPSGSTAFAYDERGNLLSETRTEGGVTLPATQYSYNDANRLNTLITPSGKVVTLTPDAAGKTTQIATTINGAQVALADAIQTDATGQVTGLTLGNGGTQSWLYNLDGTLTSGTDAPAQSPWFMSTGPVFDYPALVAAVPELAWQQNAWHAVADDADHDNDLDLFLYFNGTNENYLDITCVYDCGSWYVGPEFGNLVYLEKTTTGYVRRPFSNSDDIVPGDIEKMVPLDYNNDGKTDVLLVTTPSSSMTSNPAYVTSKPYRRLVLFKNDSGPAYATTGNPNGTHFSDVTVTTGLDKAVWYAEGLILDLDQDGYPDILGIAGGSNNTVLGDAFRYNPTTSTYQPITTSGLPRPLWAGTLADLDSDGKLDLVAQDGTLGLRFFRNAGNSTFSEWTGTQNLTGFVGADWASVLPADIDNDGKTDLAIFETAYLGEYPNQSYAGGRLRWLRNTAVTAGQITMVEQPSAAFEPPGNNEEVAYGGTVGDVNNDGWLDLLLAARDNGSRLVVANGQGDFIRPEDGGTKVGIAAPDSRFAQPVLLDLNSDGKPDLLAPQSLWTINSGNYLLMNTGTATGTRAGISIELTGSASGKDAWGARVEVTANARTQTRQVLPVMGLSRRLHFGLGANPGNVSVRIYWPNSQTPQDINATSSVNSILRVTQP